MDRQLARSGNYRRCLKNYRYNPHILQEHLWGNDFKRLGLEKARLLVGKAAAIRSKKGDMVWIWKFFGTVITIGS
jgi:hypothetical protein